ncbi:hypothetical protein [Holospora curviuscula]|uniref:Uncharacterized protein n=1 Tax=Holospora curviuscula TaxID=1082868 RepID=A0A2S5R6V5_9PROT|nr:hypothetical protein [Holospora curviuscula]PPE03017.1 hypothetical protein HCUR_01527 [Holospora curviuscula]
MKNFNLIYILCSFLILFSLEATSGRGAKSKNQSEENNQDQQFQELSKCLKNLKLNKKIRKNKYTKEYKKIEGYEADAVREEISDRFSVLILNTFQNDPRITAKIKKEDLEKLVDFYRLCYSCAAHTDRLKEALEQLQSPNPLNVPVFHEMIVKNLIPLVGEIMEDCPEISSKEIMDCVRHSFSISPVLHNGFTRTPRRDRFS